VGNQDPAALDRPRHLVLGIFRRGSLLLVGEAYDRVKHERFYRPLGGGIEPGETAERALEREMLEELGEDVRVVRRLGELDNRFVFEGRPGWEVVQVLEAQFVAPGAPEVERVEAESWQLRWISLEGLDAPLYPDGLAELLQSLRSS
jgi:8-oxo-dGTP pyrophosphatase MutT (NUDIX family)